MTRARGNKLFAAHIFALQLAARKHARKQKDDAPGTLTGDSGASGSDDRGRHYEHFNTTGRNAQTQNIS